MATELLLYKNGYNKTASVTILVEKFTRFTDPGKVSIKAEWPIVKTSYEPVKACLPAKGGCFERYSGNY